MQPLSRFARYFLVVARLGSLRRAAEELNVSASAIDRQILMAEKECETPLFERLPSGLRLTAAGEFLLTDLQRWRKDYDRTMERFAELRGLRRGHVTVALIEALSDGLLPGALANLLPAYPNLTFDLRVLPNSRIAGQLLSSEADIGLLLDPQLHPELDCRASVQFAIGLVTRPDHPLAGRPDVTASDLIGLRHIFAAPSLRVAELSRDLIEQVASGDESRTSCNSIPLVRSLIAAGQGVAILSQIDVAADLEAGRLQFTPIRSPLLKSLTLGLAVAPHRQLSRAAQMVLNALADGLTGRRTATHKAS